MKRWIFLFALVVGMASCGGGGNPELKRKINLQKQLLEKTKADVLANTLELEVDGRGVCIFRGMDFDEVVRRCGQPEKGGTSINTGEIRMVNYKGGKVTLLFTLDVLTDWVVMP